MTQVTYVLANLVVSEIIRSFPAYLFWAQTERKLSCSMNFSKREKIHLHKNPVHLKRSRFICTNKCNRPKTRFFFFYLSGGTLGTAVTTGLLYQPRMIGEGDCGEFGGMKIGRGNRSTRRKPAPAPLCPPQIPHD
jgi:hypothetical protein